MKATSVALVMLIGIGAVIAGMLIYQEMRKAQAFQAYEPELLELQEVFSIVSTP